MIPWLPPGSDFPPLEEALDDPNGLLAAGNDLAPDTLISAYTRGIFPWYDPSQPVLWWTPNPRCVFRPGDFQKKNKGKKKKKSNEGKQRNQ